MRLQDLLGRRFGLGRFSTARKAKRPLRCEAPAVMYRKPLEQRQLLSVSMFMVPNGDVLTYEAHVSEPSPQASFTIWPLPAHRWYPMSSPKWSMACWCSRGTI